MITRFFDSALWLLATHPFNCPRETFAGWLLRCICKNGESCAAQKRELIEKVLCFLELPDRKKFESDLCDFIRDYDLLAKKRFRNIIQNEIRHQVDWAQTYCANMVSNPGCLTHFITHPVKRVFDAHLLAVLQQIARELRHNLETFASLLDTDEFDTRIDQLRKAAPETAEAPAAPYDEHAAWKLRQHPRGRTLAAEIDKWHFSCSCDMNKKIDPGQKKQLTKLLAAITSVMEENCFNENDLLEGIAIIQSVQALCNRKFTIKRCVLTARKPEIELSRLLPEGVEQRVAISKNPDDFNKNDQTIAYRTVNSNPSGLQPDIIYKCSLLHGSPAKKKTFYLLGDAKNYEKSDFGPALYAMLHYLLAFSKLLDLPADFFNCGNREQFLTIKNSCKRIVLFFPENKQATIAPDHPLELVFGSDQTNLADFFEKAFSFHLTQLFPA